VPSTAGSPFDPPRSWRLGRRSASTLRAAAPTGDTRRATRSSACTAAVFSETRYAMNGDLYVAYRASQEGPRDIVLIPMWLSNCEDFPEQPSVRGWVEAMTSFGRLIIFDQPGTGSLAMFDGPQRAIRCAMAIRDAMQALGIEVHAGLHTGECEIRGDDIGGIAVHIGARVSSLAGPNDVLVSSTPSPLRKTLTGRQNGGGSASPPPGGAAPK
jgi:hypothetical protein